MQIVDAIRAICNRDKRERQNVKSKLRRQIGAQSVAKCVAEKRQTNRVNGDRYAQLRNEAARIVRRLGARHFRRRTLIVKLANSMFDCAPLRFECFSRQAAYSRMRLCTKFANRWKHF